MIFVKEWAEIIKAVYEDVPIYAYEVSDTIEIDIDEGVGKWLASHCFTHKEKLEILEVLRKSDHGTTFSEYLKEELSG